MKWRIIICIYTTLLCLNNVFSQTNKADKILGIWLTGSTNGKVEIYKCGDKYCGKIVWMKNPTYEDGTPKMDKHNPDESKRSNRTMGLVMLSGFNYDEDMEWEDGEIYDPDDGKTYSCQLTLLENKQILEVRGYIGIPLFGRTEEWIKSSLH